MITVNHKGGVFALDESDILSIMLEDMKAIEPKSMCKSPYAVLIITKRGIEYQMYRTSVKAEAEKIYIELVKIAADKTGSDLVIDCGQFVCGCTSYD